MINLNEQINQHAVELSEMAESNHPGFVRVLDTTQSDLCSQLRTNTFAHLNFLFDLHSYRRANYNKIYFNCVTICKFVIEKSRKKQF
jgi:hypothetical protein